MTIPQTLSKLSSQRGEYILIERDHIDELYRQAGFAEDEDEVPNFLTIDGQSCLFTENFVEKDGKEYEIVMVASGFSWEDILVFDASEDDF